MSNTPEFSPVEVDGLHAVVAHDPLPSDGSALPADIVVGPGGASFTLLRLLPKRRVWRGWDLGCGSGVIAAVMAQFADEVIATDIDPRALQLTEQTAKASHVKIETRLGSLDEPVLDRQFDLIAANPPFVIGNATDLTHRESPFAADGLTRELLARLPQRLAAGGTAVMLASWLETEAETWEERINEWLPADCDVWVGLRDSLAPDSYIDVWLADAGRSDDQAARSRWRQNLDGWGARGIAFGWVALRRTEKPPVVRIEDLRNAAALPTGDELELRMQAARVSEALTATELLSTRFLPVDTQHWRGHVELDPVLAAVRMHCTGQPTLAEVIADLAKLLSADQDDLTIVALAGVKALVDLGLLAAAGPAATP